MRKLNLALVAAILITFLIHGILGALQIAGANADSQKIVARICMSLICAHVAVSAALTAQTLRASHRAGTGYFRANLRFWTRRISGLTILVPLLLHLLVFRASNADAYRLQEFTTGRLISQLLLVAAIALHVLSNIRPFLISFGFRQHKALTVDLILVLSVMLLLFALAFGVYWLRWAQY